MIAEKKRITKRVFKNSWKVRIEYKLDVFINKESQRIRKESLNALDEVDPELLAKVLANPEMRALLNSLAKTMK
ncbi:MAG: hypothetical protein ACLVHS_13790 [Blautia wexlerae]